MQERVVITGLSAVGTRSTVEFAYEPLAPSHQRRGEQLALQASRSAIKDARISYLPQDRSAVVLGSCLANLEPLAAFDHSVIHGASRFVDPSLVSSGILNSVTGVVSMAIGIRGFHLPTSAGALSALQAVDFAFMQLSRRSIDIALVGGLEVFDDTPLGPPSSNAPYAGAAVLVLEALTAARRRGMSPYAECAGLGFAYSPPNGPMSPMRPGLVRALQAACRRADTVPDEIDLVLNDDWTQSLNGEIDAVRSLCAAGCAWRVLTVPEDALGATSALLVLRGAQLMRDGGAPLKGDAAESTIPASRRIAVLCASPRGERGCAILNSCG